MLLLRFLFNGKSQFNSKLNLKEIIYLTSFFVSSVQLINVNGFAAKKRSWSHEMMGQKVGDRKRDDGKGLKVDPLVK